MTPTVPTGPATPNPRDGDPPLDPGIVKLGAATMNITVFFSLLGLGYPPEQALPITAAVGLGGVALADRFLSRRRDQGGTGEHR